MAMRISTIGNLTIDDIILYDTQQIFVNSIGGDSLYSAIGARIWDASPRLIARIGKSFPPDSVSEFCEYGIDADLIKVPFNDIRDWALYEPGGARQFINHLSSGTHYEMSITGEEIPDACFQADAIHVAPMPTDVQSSVLQRLHAQKAEDTLISWDPHVDYLQEAAFNRLAYDMLQYVDLFLPSQEEVFAMFGSKDLERAAREFANAGPDIVAIKKSIEGSLLYVRDEDDFYHIPIYPSETVDPTGAGDSYCGGFLAGFLETKDPVHAARCGTVSASFVVEHVGALNTFRSDFSQIETRMEYLENYKS